MAPPPLRYAVQGFAPLGQGASISAWWKEVPKSIGKSAREWHVTLRESPIRAARLIALTQPLPRFRGKRQLWTYSGLGIETHDSAQYRYVRGQLQRSKKPQQLRGLDQNHNHEMKEIFKGAATRASCGRGRFRDFYAALLAKGMNRRWLV